MGIFDWFKKQRSGQDEDAVALAEQQAREGSLPGGDAESEMADLRTGESGSSATGNLGSRFGG